MSEYFDEEDTICADVSCSVYMQTALKNPCLEACEAQLFSRSKAAYFTQYYMLK